MPTFEDFPELKEQGYSPEAPSNLGLSLLKVAGSLAIFQVGMGAISAISGGAGRAVIRGVGSKAVQAATKSLSDAAKTTRASSVHGQIARAISVPLANISRGAGVAVKQATKAGQLTPSIGDMLMKNRDVAAMSKAYNVKMSRYRGAINAHHKTYGKMNDDIQSRVRSISGYLKPQGLGDRIVGSAESYMKEYMKLSVPVYITDRAINIFGEDRQEPGPAWYNITGHMWDYAKFTAQFLPADAAFRGVLGHGLPFLKAGVAEGVTRHLDKTHPDGSAPYRQGVKDFLSKQFSVQANRDPLSIAGMVSRAKAFVKSIGTGFEHLGKHSDPISGVKIEGGVGFRLLDPDTIKTRVAATFRDAYDAGRNAYTENVRQIMQNTTARVNRMGVNSSTHNELTAIDYLLDPGHGVAAHGPTSAIVRQAINAFSEKESKSGIIGRLLGFAGFDNTLTAEKLSKNKAYHHLAEALRNKGKDSEINRLVLNNVYSDKDAMIDVSGLRLTSVLRKGVESVSKLKMGFPFFGSKLPIGEFLMSPIHSIMDGFASSTGAMPAVRRLEKDESYLTFSQYINDIDKKNITRQTRAINVERSGNGEDVWFIRGQLYRRGPKDDANKYTLRNILEGHPEFWNPARNKPTISWVGFDKGRQNRLVKLQAQQLGMVTETYKSLYPDSDDTWHGVKRAAEVGGYAKGIFGHIKDMFHDVFSKRNPRSILGNSREKGFFDALRGKDTLGNAGANLLDLNIALKEMHYIGEDARIASFRALMKKSSIEALGATRNAGNANPIIAFKSSGVHGRDPKIDITLEELMTLPDDNLIELARKQLERGASSEYKNRPWSKNVSAITERWSNRQEHGLNDIRTKYPRSLMVGHKADLTDADELKRFLIFDELYNASIRHSKVQHLDDVFTKLHRDSIISSNELTTLQFSMRSMKLERLLGKHAGELKYIDANETESLSNEVMEFMTSNDMVDVMKSMGDRYGNFARPRSETDRQLHRLGVEQTPWTLLAKHNNNSDHGIMKQLFPDKGDPLTTIGAIPFMILDRLASVGSTLGVGYDPSKRSTAKDVAGLFGKLGVGAGLAMWGWQGLDTFFDANPLFKGTMFDEGLNVALADQYVKARTMVGAAYDVTGVTGLAQYIEGLMPGAVTSPASAMVRGLVAPVVGAKFGPKGMAIGGAVSLLTAGGPLAMFGEWDLTKNTSELQQEFRGERYVPMRKGRWWELNMSTPWEGGKISHFAPNWYHRLKSQYRNTPTQFGGKVEGFFNRDIPLLGFNPFNLLGDQYHYEAKHYLDRPYPESSPALQEVPFIGPLLGSTVGGMIKPTVGMHTAEVNATYMGGDMGWVDNSTPGIGPVPYNTGDKLAAFQSSHSYSAHNTGMQSVGYFQNPGPPPISNHSMTNIGADLFHTAIEEPGGLIGWEAATLLGGSPLAGNRIVANAGPITSHSRQYWDMQLGGLAGTTEFLRRFIPRPVSGNESFNPITNTQPGWLPGGSDSNYSLDFRTGDPYAKIPMGELRLPGAGYEASHHVNFTYPSRASAFGKSMQDQVKFFLGLDSPATVAQERIMESGTDLHRAVQQNLARMNMLVQAEATVYDPYANISGHVDAITNDGTGKRVMEIKSVSDEKLARMSMAEDPHRSQLNFYMKTLGLKQGSILYVSRDDPTNMKVFEYGYDPKRFARDIRRLEESRHVAENLRRDGIGVRAWEAYSWLDRATILSDVAPHAPETADAIARARIQIAHGQYDLDAQEKLDEVLRMRNATTRTYELYPYRFAGKLLNPSDENFVLSENRHIKAAAEYGPIARMAGAAWELLTHRDNIINRRFLNTYSPIEHYERNVLYNRPTSFWDAPIRDFVEPTVRSLISEDDPLSGAASFAITAATFGSNTFGLASAAFGAAWGSIHGAYRSISGSQWIPDIIQRDRDHSEYFDRLQYTKAQNLYQETGDKKWLQVAAETQAGVNPYDQTREGWQAFFRSMPFREKPYIDSFLKATDPGERERISRILPPGVKDTIQAKWNQLDHTELEYIDNSERTGENLDYFRKHHMPRASWLGWHPLSNMDDIKVKTLDAEGIEAHDFGLGWMQQRRRMANAPYLQGIPALDMNKPSEEPLLSPRGAGRSEVRSALDNAIRAIGLNGNVLVTQDEAGPDGVILSINIQREPSQSIANNTNAVLMRA